MLFKNLIFNPLSLFYLFKDFFYVPYSNDAFVSEEEDSTDSEEKTEKKAKKVSLL